MPRVFNEVAMKTCPDLPKGQECPECGGKYVCLFWQTHKKPQQQKDDKK